MGRELRCDLAIVGGGLAGALTAFALAVRRPEISVRLIEAVPIRAADRLWTFFSSDIDPVDRWIIEPFVSQTWNGHDVRFPAHARSLGLQVNAVRSETFDAVLRARLPEGTMLTARAVGVAATGVGLEDGTRLRARGVIDARGAAYLGLLDIGWQKFVGREVLLRRRHGLTLPMLMDAAVAQDDGMRFVCCLPLAEDRLLIRDCYFSDSARIDHARLNRRIADYAEALGWPIAEVLRDEEGLLPVVRGGDFNAYWRSGGVNVAKIGARAGLAHPTTGSALHDAVRTAALIADQTDLSGTALDTLLFGHAARAWQERSFYRRFDRALFAPGPPDQRFRLFERLYRLRPNSVSRFHAAQSTRMDRFAILAGVLPAA